MKRSLILSVLAVVAAVVLTSCADQGIEPSIAPSQQFMQIPSDSPMAVGLAKDGPGKKVNAGTTILVSAEAGGVVNCGRYTVVFPAGALSEDTEITVRACEEKRLVSCELLPHGITFNVPAQLLIDLTYTTASPTDDATVYWYNESMGVWQDVGGTLDPTTMILSTDLGHFSQYVAGRAGW